MNTSSIMERLQRLVEEACRSENNAFGYGVWTHHVLLVVRYGRMLADQLGADPEIVEIAALLHDYANITDPSSSKNHHIIGGIEAERLLRSLDYPDEKIAFVKHCIISHRGSVPLERNTPEAICLASADAMAHIDQMPSLLYLAFRELHMGIDEGTIWVRQKLERSWNKLCPEAKEQIKWKYLSARAVLTTMDSE